MAEFGLAVGNTYTVDELMQRLPCYPDGRPVRPRSAMRRLRELGVLVLVEAGPNGSLSLGASYAVCPPPVVPGVGRADVPDDELSVQWDWLKERIDRKLGE